MFSESIIGYSVTAALSTKSDKKILATLTSVVEESTNPTKPSVEIPEFAKLITKLWKAPFTGATTGSLF